MYVHNVSFLVKTIDVGQQPHLQQNSTSNMNKMNRNKNRVGPEQLDYTINNQTNHTINNQPTNHESNNKSHNKKQHVCWDTHTRVFAIAYPWHAQRCTRSALINHGGDAVRDTLSAKDYNFCNLPPCETVVILHRRNATQLVGRVEDSQAVVGGQFEGQDRHTYLRPRAPRC